MSERESVDGWERLNGWMNELNESKGFLGGCCCCCWDLEVVVWRGGIRAGGGRFGKWGCCVRSARGGSGMGWDGMGWDGMG